MRGAEEKTGGGESESKESEAGRKKRDRKRKKNAALSETDVRPRGNYNPSLKTGSSSVTQ